MSGRWSVEDNHYTSVWLLTPSGQRVAMMTKARAHGIAAAMNTPEGHAAFMAARAEVER